MKIDNTVKKESLFIASMAAVLSLLMQSVFLIVGFWDYTVLLGNLLGYFTAVLNFFLMGIGVQKAVQKDEKEAKNIIKLSQIYRNLMILVIAIIGIVLPCFNIWAVIIPLLFPRVAIALRPLLNKGDK